MSFFMFVCFCIGLSHCFMFMTKSLAHSFTTDSAFTKPLGNLCLTLTPHIWSRIGDFGLVSQLLVCRCKNVSLSLHFQALAPDDLGGFGLFCYSLILTEAPPRSPPNTHAFKQRRWHTIPTTLFETIWNGSVEVSSSPESQPWCQCISLFLPLFSPALPPLTPCLCEESHKAPLILPWHAVCFARLGCWAARQCCLAWPSCKPTTSRARRGCHHSWVKVTGPVLRATTRSMATATTVTSPIMDNPTTATWAMHLLGPVHPW